MTTHCIKVLIIGAGPAGYTAAIYASRAGLEPLLVQGMQPGGQLTITTDVENYPGFVEIQGPDLMENMRAQAAHVGTRIVSDVIETIDLSKRPFRATGDSGDEYLADAVIIATGAQAKWLGVKGETEFGGRGVSACATCDGFFYRGKEVVVIGGGNTAVEEALYLTHHATKVTLIHRRDSLRAEKILQDRLFKNPKIEVIWDHEVIEIVGNPLTGVAGVMLAGTTSSKERFVKTDGVFVAIGHAPASSIFVGHLAMDDAGYVKIAPWSTQTSVPGVFSAGDISDPVFRQAITSAGMGCMAALETERYLSAQADGQAIAAE